MKINRSGIELVFSEEVADAVNEGLPVVALESNVISHGLDYPDNVRTAKNVEAAVRRGGSIPATIAIDKGRFYIGLDDIIIERLATEKGVPKTSSRDLPVVLASGQLGATTVASSVVACDLAGLPFFSSAGIGGVHRGAQQTMDISSDLIQFTRSKVAVVCAGAKNILDLGLTLEFLETHCVPLLSYRFDDFPAFYCRSSGFKAPHRMDDAQTVAKVIEKHWQLGNHSSVLVATPTKLEDAIDSDEVNGEIDKAVHKANELGISGNGLTKFIMKSIERVTAGRTATANMAVLANTAEVAGELAKAHAQLTKSTLETQSAA